MNDLQQQANPFVQLERSNKLLIEEAEITNNLLCRLLDVQEAILAEQAGMKKHRIKVNEEWRKSKLNSSRMTKLLVILAGTALYLDIIKVDASVINAITATLSAGV